MILLYFYLKIDECSEGLSSCNQICTNIIGGYCCTCYTELCMIITPAGSIKILSKFDEILNFFIKVILQQ